MLCAFSKRMARTGFTDPGYVARELLPGWKAERKNDGKRGVCCLSQSGQQLSWVSGSIEFQ